MIIITGWWGIKKEYVFDRICLILSWFDSIMREKSGIKYFPGVM